VITVCGGIALPLSSGLVRLLPFASSYELYNFRANRAIRRVRRGLESLQVVSRDLAHPPSYRHLGHLSAPVPRLSAPSCRWRSWWGPSHSALPAAPAVRPRTVAGGHRPGLSIGTEHALCQTKHPCSPVGGMVGHARRVPQRPGSPDVRQALETGQVVLVP